MNPFFVYFSLFVAMAAVGAIRDDLGLSPWRRLSLLPLRSPAAILWVTFNFSSAAEASATDLWPLEVRK